MWIAKVLRRSEIDAGRGKVPLVDFPRSEFTHTGLFNPNLAHVSQNILMANLKSILRRQIDRLPYVRSLYKENIWLKQNQLRGEKYAQLFWSTKFQFRAENYGHLYEEFVEFTMIPPATYLKNLALADDFNTVEGCVVECGTWKGGMIAGIAKMLKEQEREYFLFDSFEGLPPARDIDGQAALDWQANKDSPIYYNNCTASIADAEKAMQKSGAMRYQLVKGWFNETLPQYLDKLQIAMLRLDGDWYDSTYACLENLFPSVVKDGIIILDDYYTWDGCARAMHDYLSRNNRTERISQFDNDVCYLVKK